MSSLSLRFVLIAAVIVCFSHLLANASRRHPKFLFMPLQQQFSGADLLYTVKMAQRTPMQDLRLLVDIEQDYTWVRCYNNSYVSSTYSPVDCSARLCKSYEYSACYTCTGPRAPGCNNHSCSVPEPGVQLGQDAAALFRSDGRHYPALRLPFSCAEQSNPSDLIHGMDGVAGMTSSTLALPAQLSAARRLSRKFGMCLSQESTIFDAYLFFGDCPLVFSPLNGGHPRDLSRHLTHTPLIRNPIKIPNSTHASTHGFYIDVQGIKVNGVDVPIDAEKLRIGAGGRGGTKLSTVVTYTQLATPIYNSLVAVYTQVAKQMNLIHVDLVEPYPPPLNYGVCFASPVLRVPLSGSTDPGLDIPSIDLILPGNTTWRILGINSMERDAIDNAFCLAFVDAGEDPVASIVIGTFQMVETLLQFDLGTSTLGFSSNLLSLPQPTRCNNFNLTTAM